MPGTCAVFVVNKSYFIKFIQTCKKLLEVGNYKGDICLLIGNDLQGSILLNHEIIRKNNIKVKHFPDIVMPESVKETITHLPCDSSWNNKFFQFHKLHLFNTYFKQWDRIFYVDCGMHIMKDVNPILEKFVPNKLLAHSDAYPTYEWSLENQFSKVEPYFSNLKSKYDLSCDYFQTTIMYYDTSIIQDDTFTRIFNTLCEFPISWTNDQGLISLYFTQIDRKWKQICLRDSSTFYYDYLRRNPGYEYIMLKSA